MTQPTNDCPNCNKEDRKKRGFLCEHKTHDELGLRCCGPQTFDKLKILQYYLEIFDGAMQEKFSHLNFVDLFAGSGKCRNRDSFEEKLGSSLIAYSLKSGFTNYIFNDLDKSTSEILLERCRRINRNRLSRVTILHEDANKDIDKILEHVPMEKSLSVILVDPNGLDVHFDTIRKLSRYGAVDLIINYAVLDLKWNRRNYESGNDKADRFFGPVDWQHMSRPEIFSAYKNSIQELGLVHVEGDHEGTYRVTTHTGAEVYYLLFASKHDKGLKFWKEAKRKYSQHSLF